MSIMANEIMKKMYSHIMTGRGETGRDGRRTGPGRGTGRDGSSRDGPGRPGLDGSRRAVTGRDGPGRNGPGRNGPGRDGLRIPMHESKKVSSNKELIKSATCRYFYYATPAKIKIHYCSFVNVGLQLQTPQLGLCLLDPTSFLWTGSARCRL